MQLLGKVALAVFGASIGGAFGCSILLETDTNSHPCVIDSDCTRYPNAVCDNVRQTCVPRLPTLNPDGGTPDSGTIDSGGALTCQISFDNSTRLPPGGPDGGLRPLPEAP